MMLNHFGFGGLVLGFFLTDDFLSKSSEDGLHSNDKCQFSLEAADQLVVVGGGYL